VLTLPAITGGFGEARDFTLAYTARLLADLGPGRLDMAGELGGPELNKTLGRAAPVTLLTETALFSALGDNQARQLAALFAAVLATMALAFHFAQRWRPERRAGALAGLIVALHPIAGGATAGLSSLATMLAVLSMLGAMEFTLVAVRRGNWTSFAPLFLLLILAAGADAVGLLAVPAVAFVAWLAPGGPRREALGRRVAVTALALVAGALTVKYMNTTYMAALGRHASYLQPWLEWRPRQLGVQVAWLLRALFLPIDPTLTAGPRWIGPLAVALPAAVLATASTMAARRRPTVLLWPVLMLVALLPTTAALSLPNAYAPPSSWAALFPALIFFAFWLAELWPDAEFPWARVLVAGLVAANMLPQTYFLTRDLADAARATNRLGREFAAVMRDAPEGVDVIVLADLTSTRPLETAFLAGNYRETTARQVRYRMLVGGRLAPSDHPLPVGGIGGINERLSYDGTKRFIGFDGQRRHIVDLTGQIAAKVTIADDEAAARRQMPPALPLLDEFFIDKWPASIVWTDFAPAKLNWYIEGAMLRLHPYAGRELL
jgi:hypothetical protein